MSRDRLLASSQPNSKSGNRSAWSLGEVRRLRELAEHGLAPNRIARELGRSEFAVRNKAGMHGISFQRYRASRT
jgi:hypothetical protein